MEMKYLAQQDNSRDLCFPLVHVNSIVGLDVNPTTTVFNQDIPLISSYLITGSKAKIVYFDNVTYISIDIHLTQEGIIYLQEGNTIELSHTGFNNTEDVVLDCITTNNDDSISDSTGYMWVKNSKLYIRATCKEKVFEENVESEGGVNEYEIIRPLSKIVGNALSTTKSFAPIRPISPNGWVEFTIPQRIESLTFVVESISAIEIENDHGHMEFTKNGDATYVVIVTNTTKDYKITIKGNMSSIVYPRASSILGVSIHDCVNLTWFSVKPNNGTNSMTQNTSIKRFSIYGKHKLYNMSHFLEGLSDLEVIDNFAIVNVTNMSSCFRDCSKLRQLPTMEFGSVMFATSMCNGCTALTLVPMMDFSSLADASYMFYKCSELISVPQFNCSRLVYANYMFGICSKLAVLNINSTSISNTENMMISAVSMYNLIMSNLAVSVNIQDTSMKTKEVIQDFITAVGIAPYDNIAVLSLPQAVSLYEFNSAFIKSVTDKNWSLK